MGRKDNVSKATSRQPLGATTPHQSVEKQYDASPPRTPPAQIGRARKPRGGASAPWTRPSLQDAFGDEMNEITNQHGRNRSNSHDLSWSPKNARHSVVDNMLLSLDRFGVASGSSRDTILPYADDTRYMPVQRGFGSSIGRPRGHTTSSSVSSDYSLRAESPLSAQNRAHRSNSNSNYQTSLGRIDSIRLPENEAAGNNGSRGLMDGQKERAIAGQGNLSKAGKRSTALNSDANRTYGGMSRPQVPPGRRSASFDNGYKQSELSRKALGSVESQNPYLYGDIEAAPTPTIPAGPRKEHEGPPSSSFTAGSSLLSTQPPPARRRSSVRNPVALFAHNDRLEVSDGQNTDQGSQTLTKCNTQSTDASGQNPVTPVKNYPLPPSTATSASTSREKERPGFFKRVFGSSRGTPTSYNESTISKKQAYPQSGTRTTGRVDSLPIGAGLPGKSMAPNPQQAQTLPKTGAKDRNTSKDTPTLNKKTSFFRRRRKSIQEPVDAIPVLPSQSHTACSDQQMDWPSLVPPDRPTVEQHPDSPSSLRRVMNPYLDNHRRLESINSVDTSESARKNRQLPTSNAYSTIRTVTATNTVTAGLAKTTNTVSSASTEAESSPSTTVRDRARVQHKRASSGEDRVPAGQRPPRKSLAESFGHSPSHTRTQSDIDKDLPRLPIDYNAVAPTSGKEALITSSDQPSDKPGSTEEDSADVAKPSVRKNSEHNLPLPERTSSQQQWHGPATSDPRANPDVLPRNYDSALSDNKSAFSKPVSPTSTAPAISNLADERLEAISFPSVDPFEPLPEHRAFAEKLFAGTANIDRAEVAPWLGELGPDRAKTRRAYMELFDWKDLSILAALRGFCSSVQLKGETQQVDRLLDSISSRWCDCNPSHGFKATDVVHTICYSVLLLNTDLHLADIESKMTRSQFIRNTMPTIRRVVEDAAPNAFDNARASMLPPPRRPQLLGEQGSSNSRYSIISSEVSEPGDLGRSTYRLSTRPSDHSGSESFAIDDDCGPLVKTPFTGRQSSWELLVEVVLKNFYNSIRQHRLPLSTSEEQQPTPDHQQSSVSLSAMTGVMLRRTNSLLSKAGSETLPARGRLMESRSGSRWSSKTRSRPRLHPASLAQSRTSFDEDQSAMSPSMSSMWSKYSLVRTQTSMSANSLGSDYPSGDYQRSIGFANALSQAIIRDDPATDSTEELVKVGPMLEDESLELEGAPWAKEGILKHKHHLEAVDKRAKDRSWSECFTVIEKGWIRLFQFNVNAKSLRQKARNKGNVGGVVGGGNWTENAQSLGQFLLRHTIASALPPPGYSKVRPHVWALSLPTGAVHLFQAGTPEIVREYVSTANYWSARLSKEPLMGGVSNVEYGWSERVINLALVSDNSTSNNNNDNNNNNNNTNNRPPSTIAGPRPSFQASIRSSIDQNSSRPKLPGDRIGISDWAPPTQSMMASQLLEVDQLRALSTYVKNIEEELRKHNQLRSPMLLAFTSRHANHNKAMGNWEKKSAYLLREIVKFTTYLESLQFAHREKERVLGEREVKERSKEAAGGEELEGDAGVEMAGGNHWEQETVLEQRA